MSALTSQAPHQEPRVNSAAPARRAPTLTPAVDVYEGNDELLLVVDLPGVQASGLSVSYDAPVLRIEGKRGEGEAAPVYVRTFHLDERVDPDSVRAELAAGVLTVKLAKPTRAKPRKIEIKAA